MATQLRQDSTGMYCEVEVLEEEVREAVTTTQPAAVIEVAAAPEPEKKRNPKPKIQW